MKRFMMKYLMVNCKQATYLMGLKEEGKLSITGRIKLNMHTSMCSFCKRFEQQTAVIKKESLHLHSQEQMPKSVEERLEKLFKRPVQE
jgi:hypothetical protein